MEGACDPATTATREERRLRLERSSLLELVTGVEEGMEVEEKVGEVEEEMEEMEEVEEEEEVGWGVGEGAGDLEILLGGFCEGLGSECTPAELVVLTEDSERVPEAGEAPPEVR